MKIVQTFLNVIVLGLFYLYEADAARKNIPSRTSLFEFAKKARECDSLGCIENVLTDAKANGASLENITDMVASTKFYSATKLLVDEAIKESYTNYLAYLIMAEHDGISAALFKDQALSVSVLLSYAYDESWCSPRYWNRRARQFKVDVLAADNVNLVRDILDDKSHKIPNDVRNELKQQIPLSPSLSSKLAEYDAVKVFSWLFEEGMLELDFEPILQFGSIKILDYLASVSIPIPDDRKLSNLRTKALPKILGTNNLKLIEYLLKNHQVHGPIHNVYEYVSVSTLQFLFKKYGKQIFEWIKFYHLDLEGIQFCTKYCAAFLYATVPSSILKNSDSKLKEWALDNPQYVKNPLALSQLLVKELEFVKELYKHHGLMPHTNGLMAAYRMDRLDIVKWWHGTRPDDIIASLSSKDIIYAKRSVLNWIHETYPKKFNATAMLETYDAVFGMNLGFERKCREFVQWYEQLQSPLTKSIRSLADIEREFESSTNLSHLNSLLEKVDNESMGEKIRLMMMTSFYFADDSFIKEAIEKGYEYYLKYLIEAEDGGESVPLKKNWASNVNLLLSYAYKKPWCSFEHWCRRADVFGVDLVVGDNATLFQDVFQDEKSDIPDEIKSKLEKQLDNKCLDLVAKYDAVNIFRWLLKNDMAEWRMMPLLHYSSTKILNYLAENNISFEKDPCLESPITMFSAVEVGKLKVIEYLFSQPKMRLNLTLKEHVPAGALEKLDQEILSRTTFLDLDLEGIKFLSQNPDKYDKEKLKKTILSSLIKGKDDELKKWLLDQSQYLDVFMLAKIVLEDLEFAKKIHQRYNDLKPIFSVLESTPFTVCKEGRLDIIQWLGEVDPRFFTSSKWKMALLLANEQIFDWLHKNHPEELGSIFDNLIEESFTGGGFAFIKWAHKIMTESLDAAQRSEWSKSSRGKQIQHYIELDIKRGEFHVLEWAMKHPELYPDEEFIMSLESGFSLSKCKLAYFQEYYRHVKTNDLEHDPYGPTIELPECEHCHRLVDK